MNKWVILLRGINVGGKMLIKMADLRTHLAAAGFDTVKTLLQSGNIVVGSDHASKDEVVQVVDEVLRTHFQMSPKVIVLSAKEFAEVMSENPFPLESESVGKWVQIYFGTVADQRMAIGEFGSRYEGPEVIVSTASTLYVYFPVGIGESVLFREKVFGKLTADLTARNWNTVQKISAEL